MAGRKTKKRFNGFVCLGILIMLTIFGFTMYVEAEEYFAVKHQLENAVKEREAATAKNLELVNDMIYHDSDAYIEKIARERLGLVKPNEIVYIDENK